MVPAPTLNLTYYHLCLTLLTLWGYLPPPPPPPNPVKIICKALNSLTISSRITRLNDGPFTLPVKAVTPTHSWAKAIIRCNTHSLKAPPATAANRLDTRNLFHLLNSYSKM